MALAGLPKGIAEIGPILFIKGRAFEQQGRTVEAIQSHEEAAEVFGFHQKLTELADAYEALGTLYAKHNDLPKSNESLQKMRKTLNENLKKRGFRA